MSKKSKCGCEHFSKLHKISRRTCFPFFSSWRGWIPQTFLGYNVYYFRKVTRWMTWLKFSSLYQIMNIIFLTDIITIQMFGIFIDLCMKLSLVLCGDWEWRSLSPLHECGLKSTLSEGSSRIQTPKKILNAYSLSFKIKVTFGENFLKLRQTN